VLATASNRPVLLAAFAALVLGLWACSDRSEDAAARNAEPLFDGAAPQAGALAEASPEVPDDAPLVVVLGDSVAAGLHLAADEAFPAVVQRDLARRGVPFRLVNAGVSGDTTAGGLRRLDWLLRQDPDVIVVELGNNDGLRGQPPEAVEANLRAILELCAEADVRVLLLGVRVPPNLGGDYATKFEALYPRLAEEFGVAYLPFFLEGVAGVPELNLPDGMHPTAEGHRRLAERIGAALEPVLTSLED
jgi:acyl-CoA thioesterase I